MCTAITFSAAHACFGRNLDLEYTYDERVVIAPRCFPFTFRNLPPLSHHHAMIGMATVVEGYPLYYDAMNEHGLCMAGLNFVGNAVFEKTPISPVPLATFELIPYLLGNYKSVAEVKEALDRICILDTAFSEELPCAELHWIIADKTDTIVLECQEDGMHVYDTPLGVLTNNPPFPHQMQHLSNFRNLSAEESQNRFCKELSLPAYSRGMGALGLPGDLSSSSRFVRAAFVKCNSAKPDTPIDTVGQFFHLLGAVEQQEGCVRLKGGCERTQYSCCCDTDDLVYYYRTYQNSRICGVRLAPKECSADALSIFPLMLSQEIRMQN